MNKFVWLIKNYCIIQNQYYILKQQQTFYLTILQVTHRNIIHPNPMNSSSYRQSTSPQNRSGSSFVIMTNGQQAKSFNTRQTLQQAKSSSSVDIKSKQKQQHLIMKILMMSFQIQRKDVVVKNLLKQLETLSNKNSLSNNQQFYSLQKQLSQSKRYAQDLEFKLNQLELTNKQLEVNKKSTSRELEERITFLEVRNKELEVRKIQLQSEYQKLMTQNKMINYKLVNLESTQKGKNRQMQNQLINMQKRIDQQKKISNQLKIIIQSKYQQIRVLKQNQQRIHRQYDQRFRSMENQLNHRQDLKRSQAINSQQKIQMTQQELVRMQDEIKFLRKKLDDQHILFERKQQEMLADLKRSKDIEAELFSARHQNTVLKGELDQRIMQISNISRQLNDAKSAYHQLQQSRMQSEQQTTQSFQQRIYLIQQQTQTYRQKLLNSQNQLDNLRTQNRKLKRKANQHPSSTQCTSCKILQSATSIKSVKVINDINLNEIIEQTQKLHNSSLKIEQMLSNRRISYMHVGNNNGGVYDSRMSIQRSYVYDE